MARNMPRPSGSSGSSTTTNEGDEPNQAGAGFRGVARTILDTDFPTTRARLEDQIGEEKVEIAKGKRVAMRDILAQLPEENFESDVEFRRSVEQHWQGIANLVVDEEQRPTRGRPIRGARTTPKKARGTRGSAPEKTKVNQGRTIRRNAGTKGGQRDARKRGSNRGGNERSGGRGGNQRTAGRGRQQKGSKTQRASRQRKQALGARNPRTRGRRTGAVANRRNAARSR